MWKEFRIAIICGIILAGVNFLKMLLLDHTTILVAAVVSITLVVTLICAKVLGCILPMLAKKAGFDPAVMASPFITTVVDAVSLFTYFSVATLILGL